MIIFLLLFFVVTLEGSEWYKVLEGDDRVIVVAGHAAPHMRQGIIKNADPGSGILAEYLHFESGCTVVMTTGLAPTDPNFSPDCPLKRLVEERKPLLVLDLHTAHPSRPFSIDLGTMEGESLLGSLHLRANLENEFRSEGIEALSRDFFSAQRQETMTRWLSRRGIRCIQLEINSNHLPTSHNRYAINGMIPIAKSVKNFINSHRPNLLSAVEGKELSKVP